MPRDTGPRETDVDTLAELETTIQLMEKETGQRPKALMMNPADVAEHIDERLLRRWCERHKIVLVIHAAIARGNYNFAASVPEELHDLTTRDPTARFTRRLN
jgi:hypothetical protein